MYCAILQRLTTMNSEPTTEIEFNQKTNFLAFGDVSGLLQVVELFKNENRVDPQTQPPSKEESSIQPKKTTFQG